MNINKYTRGKTICKHPYIGFAGGYPKFRIMPHFVRWGKWLSIFWLGTELIVEVKHV